MGNQKNRGKIPPRYRHKIADHRRLWSIWNGIKRRCLNSNDVRFKDYGGRGISICSEWLNFDNFAEWALSHGYNDKLTIERENVNRDYCPENCTWIPRNKQCLNTRNSIRVCYKGKEWVLSELCKEMNVKYDTVHNRITVLGWDIERAIVEKSQQEDSFNSKCKRAGIHPETVRSRVTKLGWSLEKALCTPPSAKTHGA